MVLAWARTIHKFQGLQAGPTFSTQKIIADPGTERFEAGTPGLLYTLISRAVTIGKLEGGQLDSALYFFGSNMSEKRSTSLSKRIDGTKTKAVLKRDLWVAYLSHRVKSCIETVRHYSKENEMRRTKIMLTSHEHVDIEDVIKQYVEQLERTDQRTQQRDHSFNKWIDERKKNNNNGLKEQPCDNTSKGDTRDDKTNCNKNTNNVSDSESEVSLIGCLNMDNEYDLYAEEPITTEGIFAIPDIIKHYAFDIRDVHNNGNCGWYVIQEGLMDNKIPFEDEMNKFRSSIYHFFAKSNLEDIFLHTSSINKRRIMQRIWNSSTNFNTGCQERHWFDSGEIMPIITHMFRVNCVCYTIHDTSPITVATVTRADKTVCIQERDFINPAKICETSMYKETIGLIFLHEQRHYMYAKLRI